MLPGLLSASLTSVVLCWTCVLSCFLQERKGYISGNVDEEDDEEDEDEEDEEEDGGHEEQKGGRR